MGNSALCAPYVTNGGSSKVVGINGVVEEYPRPITAAKLMLENPGLFLCESSTLKVGGRIAGLSGDHQLLRHRLYFLLPVDMLYSVLTEEEMVTLTYRAAAAALVKTSPSPVSGTRKMGKIINLTAIVGDFCLFQYSDHARRVSGDPAGKGEKAARMARQRSWRPSLDTIHEVHG